MAIVDARVLRSLTLSETKDKQAVKLSASQEFLVISDAKNPLFSDILANTDTFTNLAGASLPRLDDVVTVNGVSLIVTDRKLTWYEDSDRVVQMSVSYAGFDADADEPDKPDGESEPTWRRISVRSQQQTKPARGWDSLAGALGADEAQIQQPRNSAGDPVDGIEQDSAIAALTYTNPQVVIPNFGMLQAYVNTCNTAQFLGGQAYTVRCVGWSGEYDEKVQAWSISVEFLYNPDGWQVEYLDAGFNQIVGGERRVITDVPGNPVSQPVPLDGAGAALAPGFAVADLTTKEIYPYAAFDLNNIWIDCGI